MEPIKIRGTRCSMTGRFPKLSRKSSRDADCRLLDPNEAKAQVRANYFRETLPSGNVGTFWSHQVNDADPVVSNKPEGAGDPDIGVVLTVLAMGDPFGVESEVLDRRASIHYEAEVRADTLRVAQRPAGTAERQGRIRSTAQLLSGELTCLKCNVGNRIEKN